MKWVTFEDGRTIRIYKAGCRLGWKTLASLAGAIAIVGCGGDGARTGPTALMPIGGTLAAILSLDQELDLPDRHGIAAGTFSVAPGDMDEHGNVVVSCPLTGPACTVTVSSDGTAVYDTRGGIPNVVPAFASWVLPSGHGLGPCRFTVAPGTTTERGNVRISCPVGGPACEIEVATRNTASYTLTGGVPDVLLTPPEELPKLRAQSSMHAMQAPIVDLNGTLHIGSDVGTPANDLTEAASHARVTVWHGAVEDSLGANTIAAYLTGPRRGGVIIPGRPKPEEDPNRQLSMKTYPGTQTVKLTEAAQELTDYVIRAIQLINAAIPRENRLTFSTETAEPGFGEPGEIPIHLHRAEQDHGTSGTAYYHEVDGRRTSAYVVIQARNTIDRVDQAPDEQTRSWTAQQVLDTVTHEILHTMGIDWHPDPLIFPESVMAYSNRTNPGHTLFPIDREVLVASITTIRPVASETEIYEDLGDWEETSTHLRAELETTGGDIAFGVASRDGFAQPWVTGPTPWTELGNNTELTGTASWSGRLIGFTPQTQAVAGSAELGIDLGTLEGDLEFTGLEYWAANTAPSEVGSGSRWGDGDLGYQVKVEGNTFRQTGGDEGIVTGAFFGPGHEGMGGVLDRADVAASFAGQQ